MQRVLLSVLLAITTSAPLGAEDPTPTLASLADFSRRGQISQVIQTANSLLATNKLAPADQAMALIYLGYAHQERGEFTEATASYEKALAVADRGGQPSTEYAATLATLASVYAEIGQIDTAKHVLLRSVHLFEQQSDHADSAMIWNDLATIAAENHARGDAHKYMAHSLAESRLATDIAPGELAALATTQGSIAELDGDPRTAVSDYQHALDLWRQTHQNQQERIAWLNVLLGRAYLQAGDMANARASITSGLDQLEAGSGRHTVRYLLAQLTYSRILDASGAHDEASTLRKQAQSALNTGTDRQRVQSTISISALR